MTGLPDVLIQCAFTSDYTDTTPTWVDITAYGMDFTIRRGRQNAEGACDPGTLTLHLDNTSGEFDPDNSSGTYYGYLRPMRRVRVTTTVNGNAYVLFTGYVDDWWQTWPGGAVQCVTEVTATDRSKILNKMPPITVSRVAEDADSRLTALLDAAGVSSTDYIINDDAFAARALVATPYDKANPLQAVQDAAMSDGGMLFVDGTGSFVFQTVKYRQISGATRARTSQVRLGNDATSIPIAADLRRGVGESVMANHVTCTDGTGAAVTDSDTALMESDGPVSLDLGATLLESTDAADRVSDVLDLMKNPTVRYPSIPVDVLTIDTAVNQEKVLGRELSDRATVAIIPPGDTAGTARDQWVEGVEDVVTIQPGASWVRTFACSSAGDAATAIS